MNNSEKDMAESTSEGYRGISMASGEPVALPGKEVYLDGLENTADDIKEMEEVRKNTMTAGDKRMITALWLLNAAVFAFIGLFLAFTGSADEYSSIKEEARFETEDGPATYYDPSSVFSEALTPNYQASEYPDGLLPGFEALYSENSDTAAWIRIPDTTVDHVVLQTDNHTDYDRTTFYGDYYVGGSLFMDYRNRIAKSPKYLSKNTIIYGHYLKNQRGMFSDLDKYMDVEYYKEHPVIELSTLYNNFEWKIIGAFVAAVEEQYDNALFYYWYDNFSDSNTLGFANEVAFRSYFINPSVDVQPTDKFLTLSTCSHSMDIGGMVNARFVVVARLVREGETRDVNVSTAYKNPDQRMPQLWYDQQGLVNPHSQYAIWDAFA